MITTASPILGTGGGVVVIPNEAQRKDELAAYQTELTRLSKLLDFNADILIAQSAHETANWTSHWWVERLNPAGIGITGDPVQNAASPTFANGTDAARAHVVHMAAYVLTVSAEIWRELWPYAGLDPRLQAVYDAGFMGTVKTINDLTGKWAVDPNYAEKIAAKANQLFKEVAPMADELNMTKGLVPFPAFTPKLILDSQNAAWDNLGPRNVKGIVLHRMLGGLDSTDRYFRTMAHAGEVNANGTVNPGGLTDFGIDATTGVVYQWNDYTGKAHDGVSPNRAGWASGRVIAPYGDGLAFVNKYGLNAVNRDQVSLEHSGNYGDAVSAKAYAWDVQAIASLAHDYGIPWNLWPIAPQDGFSFLRWHQEFTGPQEKVCPGSVIMNYTAKLIEDVRLLLKSAQTTVLDDPKPPTIPVKARKPSWFDHGVKTKTDQHDGPFLAQYLSRRFKVLPDRKVQKRLYAGTDAPVVSVLTENQEIQSTFIFDLEDDQGRSIDWVLDTEGFAYTRSGFTPKVEVERREEA